jgi:hypothetical protein
MTEGASFLLCYENLLKFAHLEPVALPTVGEIEREAFVSLIKRLLLSVDIDEHWYRKQNLMSMRRLPLAPIGAASIIS